MNRFTNQLDALGRIVTAIKGYRNQIPHYQAITDNEAADVYLKQHLTPQDWLFWQELQIREQILSHTIKKGDS